MTADPQPRTSAASDGDSTLTVEIAGRAVVCDWRGAAYFPDHRLLAFSDLHLEKGSSFARRGSFVPPYDTHNTLARADVLIAEYDPAVVVCLGDSFHDSEGHDRLPAEIESALGALAAGRDWCWIAGNHDPYAPVNLPGFSADELTVGPVTFRHEPFAAMAGGEVAGHLHPAARISRRGRSVRRACFAVDDRRMIMPAFGAFTGSLNVLSPAYDRLFPRRAFRALLLGDRRVYPIAADALVPDRSNTLERTGRRRA
ncbi:MAG: ligase-associated DNA damage response endonuclease PdeM [Rhizobiaceae bacterium]